MKRSSSCEGDRQCWRRALVLAASLPRAVGARRKASCLTRVCSTQHRWPALGRGAAPSPVAVTGKTCLGALAVDSLRADHADTETVVASATPSQLRCLCHCSVRGLPALLCPLAEEGAGDTDRDDARTGCRPPYRAGVFSTAGKLALVFCCPLSPIHADVTHKCASGAQESPQQAVHHPTMRWHLPDFPTIFSNSHGCFHALLQPTPLPRPHAPLAGASSALLLFPAWHLILYISTYFYHKTF